LLAGSFPLSLNVGNSDLDVVCQINNPVGFATKISSVFAWRPGFQLRMRVVDGLPTVLANFFYLSFPVEVFAQPRPPWRQRAVLHLNVERRLLRLGGRELRDCVYALKQGGVKTEPAFAQCLNLTGDPYIKLLEIAYLADKELHKIIANIQKQS